MGHTMFVKREEIVMRKRSVRVLGIFVLVLFLAATAVFAKGIQSVGFLAGFMSGNLRNKDDYEVIPLMVSFGFDLKPLSEKIGIKTKGILEFEVEPFLSPVIGPDSNLETGVNLLFKYGFPLNSRLMPYVKFGAGPSFMTQHTRGQSTQFNFVDSVGGGVSWLVKDNMSLDLEYRFRHLSNCGIDKPNSGINSQLFLAGVTYRFK